MAFITRGDTNMMLILRGGWMVRQKLDVIGRMGVRGSQCSGDPIFLYFFIKENWICGMTKHNAEPNINISLTRNLPFDSHVLISLECLWTKWNNRTRGQFEYGVTWFWFCFDFVRSHARYHLERGLCLKLDVQSQGTSYVYHPLLPRHCDFCVIF